MENFGILALFQVLIVDNFGILALLQVLIENKHLPGIEPKTFCITSHHSCMPHQFLENKYLAHPPPLPSSLTLVFHPCSLSPPLSTLLSHPSVLTHHLSSLIPHPFSLIPPLWQKTHLFPQLTIKNILVTETFVMDAKKKCPCLITNNFVIN